MHPDAYKQMAEIERDHWWFVGRRKIIGTILSGLMLPANAQILEVGSGTGGNLEMLSACGQVRAIEMDPGAAATAVARFGTSVRVTAGRFPEVLESEDEKYDLICFFDVLEHLEGDSAAVHAAINKLRPGGRILVTVPAYQWLWSPHDTFLHHHRRYSLPVLSKIFAKSGLSIQRATYFNLFLLPMMIFVRLLDAFLGREKGSGSGMPSAFVNKVLRIIFLLEASLLGKVNFPFGGSILAVSKKY